MASRVGCYTSYRTGFGLVTASILVTGGSLQVIIGFTQLLLGNFLSFIDLPVGLVSGLWHVITGVIGICTRKPRQCTITAYMVMSIIGASLTSPSTFFVYILSFAFTQISLCWNTPSNTCDWNALAVSKIFLLVVCGVEFLTNLAIAVTCCCGMCSCNGQPDRSEGVLPVLPDQRGCYEAWKILPANPSLRMLDEKENYVMSGSKRKGLALIINNSLPEGNGSDIDVSNMKHVLTEIGYEILIRENLHAEEIQTNLDNVVALANAGEAKHQSLVLVLMGKGNHEGLYGVDNKLVTVDDIRSTFTCRQCPALSDKPKIVFIQTCQGNKVTERATNEELSTGLDPTSEIDLQDKELLPMLHNANEMDEGVRVQNKKTDQTNSPDVFIAHSESNSYVSLQRQKSGSLFISTLCEELISSAHVDDLDTIMTRVDQSITHRHGYIRDEQGTMQPVRQTAISQQGVRKKIFFLPKYPPGDEGDSEDTRL